jgi:hypothetical protein
MVIAGTKKRNIQGIMLKKYLMLACPSKKNPLRNRKLDRPSSNVIKIYAMGRLK